ncbi:hypothetical protein D3C74_239570 [compost metagenome]
MALKSWQDAWFIFFRDIRRDWLYLIFTVFFMIYTGIMLGSMIHTRIEAQFILNPMVDMLMMMMSPMIGFYFTRRSLSYLKEDSYTQMLMYYRSLPIPTEIVVMSRYVQMGTAIIVNGIVLYGAMYVLPFGLDDMNFSNYLVFVLTWIGFAMIINTIYIHFELLSNSRVYTMMTLLVMVCTIILALIITVFDGNAVMYSIECSQRYGFASPLMWGSLILGFIMIGMFGEKTKYRLAQRSFVK